MNEARTFMCSFINSIFGVEVCVSVEATVGTIRYVCGTSLRWGGRLVRPTESGIRRCMNIAVN